MIKMSLPLSLSQIPLYSPLPPPSFLFKFLILSSALSSYIFLLGVGGLSPVPPIYYTHTTLSFVKVLTPLFQHMILPIQT